MLCKSSSAMRSQATADPHVRPPEASWHTDYRDTAYIYIGGLPFDLSEGDIVTIFSQYGEPTHVNLVRDRDTGKSKGFAFLKYEDQRSTDLAVDNLGGATVLGRMLRVDHTRYKKREKREGEESEEEDNVKTWKKPRVDRDGSGARDVEEPQRALLKEERELAELMRDHDEEDPMKEYLIQEKKEEVEQALAKLETKKHKYRHRREPGEDGDEDGEGRSHRHRHHHHRSRRRSEDRHKDENSRDGRRSPRQSSPRDARLDRDEERSYRKSSRRSRSREGERDGKGRTGPATIDRIDKRSDTQDRDRRKYRSRSRERRD